MRRLAILLMLLSVAAAQDYFGDYSHKSMGNYVGGDSSNCTIPPGWTEYRGDTSHKDLGFRTVGEDTCTIPSGWTEYKGAFSHKVQEDKAANCGVPAGWVNYEEKYVTRTITELYPCGVSLTWLPYYEQYVHREINASACPFQSQYIITTVSPSQQIVFPNYNVQVSLNILNNQTVADVLNITCSGNCTYSENPVSLGAGQGRAVTVTVRTPSPAATTAGNTPYTVDFNITSTTNASVVGIASAGMPIDTVTWRDQWTDAYGAEYRHRVPVAVANRGNSTLAGNYSMGVVVDGTLLYNQGKLRLDGNDLRAVYLGTGAYRDIDRVSYPSTTTITLIPKSDDDMNYNTKDANCAANPAYLYKAYSHANQGNVTNYPWYALTYNDSGWGTGNAPFSGYAFGCTAALTSAPDDLFVRKWVTLADTPDFGMLYAGYDDGARCYVNGNLVFDGITEAHGTSWWDKVIKLPYGTLKAGNNLLACWVANGGENAGGAGAPGGFDARLDAVYESWNVPNTTVWFATQAPIGPGENDSGYYLYYGGATAGKPPADGGRIFALYDDFSAFDIYKWGKIDNGNYLNVYGGKLVASGGSSAWTSNGIYSTSAFPRDNLSLEFGYLWTGGNYFMFGWKNIGSGTSYTDLTYGFYSNGANTDDVYEDGANRGDRGNWALNQSYRVRISMNAAGGALYERSANNGLNWSTWYNSTYSAASPLKIGLFNDAQAFEVDNLFVRRYVTPEPLATKAGEQKAGYRVLVRRCGMKQPGANVTAFEVNTTNVVASCIADQYGVCTVEAPANTYDARIIFPDNATSWRYGLRIG